MKVEQNQIDKLNLELTVEIGAADYAEELRKMLAEKKRTTDFKGFRKGMVPMSLIKKFYGEQCLALAVDELLSDAIQKYREENNLHLIGKPLTSEKQPELEWAEGNNFTFVLDLALRPEVEFEVSKEDKITFYSISATDEEKQKMVESLKKFYEGQKGESEGENEGENKEKKSDEDIVKEAEERLSNSYQSEAVWRFNRDLRDYFIKKSGVELPEAFMKRLLLESDNDRVNEENVDEFFSRVAPDYKWEIVRDYLFKKYDFKIEKEEVLATIEEDVRIRYGMYGITDVPEDAVKEAVSRAIVDQASVDDTVERLKTMKVMDRLKEEITIVNEEISSDKYKEL